MSASQTGPIFQGHSYDSFSGMTYVNGRDPHQQTLSHAPEQAHLKLNAISVKASRDASDAGGAHSGRSDTTHQASLPGSAKAFGAAPAGSLLAAQQREPASPDSVVTAPKAEAAALGSPASAPSAQLPELCPLPPPEPSEGPEAAAEYEVYLQRWEAGETLAQRWHRLAQSGKLDDIRADWEDWQLDVMLEQVKARSQTAQQQQQPLPPRPGTITPSNGGSGRRRGRGEGEEPMEVLVDEPRRVRSRRAPSTLQDYHVENAAAPTTKTPDRLEADVPAAAGASGSFTANTYQQRQLQQRPEYCGADASEESNDEGADMLGQGRSGAMEYHHLQQQQARVAMSRMNGMPQQQLVLMQQQQQQQPKRPPSAAKVQRPIHQPQPQARQVSRVATPYNTQHVQPQLQASRSQMFGEQQQQQAQALHLQQQMLQLQHMMGHMPMQQQQQVGQCVSEETLKQFYEIGAALGSVMQENPAALLTNPGAMSALVETVLQQMTGDPMKAIQQLAASMAGHTSR